MGAAVDHIRFGLAAADNHTEREILLTSNP